MFPPGSPSTDVVRAAFLAPDDRAKDLLVDYEMGGIHVNDPSAGLQYQVWKAWLSGSDVMLSTIDDEDEQILFEATPTELSLTFDQNMRPTVAFVQGTMGFLRWFDPVVNTMVTTSYTGIYSPFLTLDDKRLPFIQVSDILFAYLRGNACYMRVQRDRFETEYLVQDNLPQGESRIIGFGKNRQNRVQVAIETVY